MKAWAWFGIPALVLAAAYAATPVLVASFAGHNAPAVIIAQPKLPDDTVKPVNLSVAGQEIDYSAFGDKVNKAPTNFKPELVAAEPTLQSILMADADSIAVVDGNMVREGDKVGIYRVAKIDTRTVTLATTRITNTRVGKLVK